MGKNNRQAACAFVRGPECEALRELPANAAKLWIAIRFGRREEADFAIGVRDFNDWGMGRDAVSRALSALIDAGLLRRVTKSSFGQKRKRAVYQIVHRREADSLQSVQPDKAVAHSPDSRTMKREQSGKTDCRSTLQSENTDITSTFSVPLERRKDKEKVQDEERGSAVKKNRERLLRIERAAKAVAMTDGAFMKMAGGPEPADFLAQKFSRGDLDALQLRAALADPLVGSAKEGAGVFKSRDEQERWNAPLVMVAG